MSHSFEPILEAGNGKHVSVFVGMKLVIHLQTIIKLCIEAQWSCSPCCNAFSYSQFLKHCFGNDYDDDGDDDDGDDDEDGDDDDGGGGDDASIACLVSLSLRFYLLPIQALRCVYYVLCIDHLWQHLKIHLDF